MLVQAGSGAATFGQPSSAGVPEAITSQTAVLPLDDEDILTDFFAKHGDKLAAAVIEGIPANNGLLIQRPEYMQLLRKLTAKHGALLILDEVITGFRLGLGGAAAYYNLTPDLLTYGKIIGGGMPVGAFAGRAEVMDKLSPEGPVYQAGTLSGNPVAMVAGLTTLNKLADGRIHVTLETNTRRFVERLSVKLTGKGVNVISLASIFWLTWQQEIPRRADAIETAGINCYNRIYENILNSGLYLPPSGYEVCFVSAALTEQMLDEAADLLASLID